MNIAGSVKWLLALVFVAGLGAGPAIAQPAQDRASTEAKQEAQQPGNNKPFWADVQAGRIGSTQVQNIEAGSIINPQGQVWRALHEGPIPFWGAIWLIAVIVALLLWHFIVGPMRLHEPETGRRIWRFSAWERTLHWTLATSFVLLALTGLILFFGKYYLAMLLTYPIYSWVARFSVSLHNFTAPVFAVSLILAVLAFLRRNVWQAHDWRWFRRGGGFIGKRDPGSGFFNAGEKLWFWGGVTLVGVAMIVSGLILLFPVFSQTRAMLAGADIVHVIGALLFVGAAFGHIYIGTIGMRGAYRAMRKGWVDETWAKEHHRFWYEDLKSGRAREASAEPLVTPRAEPGVPRPAR